MKNVLIINGHPDKISFCHEIAQSYLRGAQSSGYQCTLLQLSKLSFSPLLRYGYRQRTELEPDLLMAQQLISEAHHIVWVYPTWWGTYPALLKGFIDRTFLPGFAFKYREGSLLWDKLLKGKSARMIVTMDTPLWYYHLIYLSPGHRAMKKGLLQFCGIHPVRITTLGPVKKSLNKQRKAWLQRVEKMGTKMQ